MDKCLQTALISKVFMLQGRGFAQIARNFKVFPKLINFLFFELFKIEKVGFAWLCVFIEPSGTNILEQKRRYQLKDVQIKQKERRRKCNKILGEFDR